MASKKEKISTSAYGLRLYTDVFHLDALHFGLFDKNDPLTLDGLKIAQKRYTNRLIELIPKCVKKILDVGCGTGSNAEELIKKGYNVSCLSPDSYQEQKVKERLSANVIFYKSKFEDFVSNEKFDLILFSESVQYIPLKALFSKSKDMLIDGGYILASDYFRKELGKYYKTCQLVDDFFNLSKEAGFKEIYKENITERVVPTLVVGKNIYEGYALPIVNIVKDFLLERSPLFSKSVYFFFKKKFIKLENYLYKHTPDKLDKDRFLKEIVYLMCIFKKGE